MLDTTHPVERINIILGTLEANVMIADRKSAKKAEKLGLEGEIIVLEDIFDTQFSKEKEAEADVSLSALIVQMLSVIRHLLTLMYLLRIYIRA